MPTHVSDVQTTTSSEAMMPLAVRVHGEYWEMPGLRRTVRQAAQLLGTTV